MDWIETPTGEHASYGPIEDRREPGADGAGLLSLHEPASRIHVGILVYGNPARLRELLVLAQRTE